MRRPLHALSLAALLCSAAPAAFAQAVSTANPAAPSGISQEAALALAARLDALEKRNEELEGQILDLKSQVSSGDQAIREQVNATTVGVANGRPTISTGDGQFTAAFRSVIQLDAAHFDQDPPGPLA